MAKLQNKDNNRSKYFEFLIDSGADYTLLSSIDAFSLGVDYTILLAKETKVEVANSTIIYAKETTFLINIGDSKFQIPVLISKENIEPLLGRKGVFNNFDITFRESAKEVVFQKI